MDISKNQYRSTGGLEARAEILTKIMLIFWEIWKSPKGHFEINWPLEQENNKSNFHNLLPDLQNTSFNIIDTFSIEAKLKKYLGKSNAPSEIVSPFFVG